MPSTDPTDELGQGLNCVIENLIYLQYQISQLIPQSPGVGSNPDPVTCAQLTGLVNVTNGWLYAITLAIKNASSGAPVDLTAVVQQLAEIGAGAIGTPPAIANAAAVIAAPLSELANAISISPGTDVSGIVAALAKLFQTIDIPPETVQSLVDQGYLGADAMKTVGQGDFGDVLITTIVNFAYKAVQNFMIAWGISYSGGALHFANPADTFAKDVGSGFTGLLSIGDTAIAPTVKALIADVVALLKPAGSTTIGVVGVNPDGPVTAAISIAVTSAAAAWLLSFAGIDEGESLTRIAEIIAGAAGFEELRDVVIGPLVRNGIGKIADMQAKAQFKQEIPGTEQLGSLVAMGLLSPTRRDAIAQFNGTPDELAPMIAAASYRGLNARQMLRLIETGLFSDAEIADELTFSALRPVSQARMIRAAPYLATASQRSSLLAAIEAAAVAGLLSDSDLTSQVNAAESNDDLDSLIVARVHLQQLVQESKDLETEYTTLFVGGLIDDATYRANLAAIGLQPWKVNTVAAKAEARANSTLRRKELAEAAAVARKTAGEEQQAAIKNFMNGNIDAAALAAALIATGLTATQVAAIADLQVLRLSGGLRWLYGLQLPAAAAALLRERVSALTDQRKRLQIDDPTYVSQLQALGIGPRYVNALQAAADALISPKTAAFPITVKTN